MTSLGFKARVGSELFIFCGDESNIHSLRSTSGATLTDLLTTGIISGHFPTYFSRGGNWLRSQGLGYLSFTKTYSFRDRNSAILSLRASGFSRESKGKKGIKKGTPRSFLLGVPTCESCPCPEAMIGLVRSRNFEEGP